MVHSLKYLNNKKVIVLNKVGPFKLRDEFSREVQEIPDNHSESGRVGCRFSVRAFAPYIPCHTDPLRPEQINSKRNQFCEGKNWNGGNPEQNKPFYPKENRFNRPIHGGSAKRYTAVCR